MIFLGINIVLRYLGNVPKLSDILVSFSTQLDSSGLSLTQLESVGYTFSAILTQRYSHIN